MAEAEEDRQSLIDGSYLFLRKLTENVAVPAFVDGSQLVDQREGLLGETTLARREVAIEEPSPGAPVTGTTHTSRKRW